MVYVLCGQIVETKRRLISREEKKGRINDVHRPAVVLAEPCMSGEMLLAPWTEVRKCAPWLGAWRRRRHLRRATQPLQPPYFDKHARHQRSHIVVERNLHRYRAFGC